MYLEFYGFQEAPFAITPDPRFVFLSERHRDALAHLLFGIGQGGGGGFVQLTGEVGTGKTTLSRLLLEQLPEGTHVALVLNPRVSPLELLATICEELHLPVGDERPGKKSHVDALNRYLLERHAAGERVVLILDEAQNLSVAALEQVRLLTNLETPTRKLMQILLLGQPELRELLARPDLRQLAQRITARYHLTPLDRDETSAYVRHRLAIAGGKRSPFTRAALGALYHRSGGIPRLINLIADRALLAGYVTEQSPIGRRLMQRAADEVLGTAETRRRWWVAVMAAAVAVMALAGSAWLRPDAFGLAPGPVPKPAPEPDLAAALAAAPADDALAWHRYAALWEDPEVAPRELVRCTPRPAPGWFCIGARANLGRLAALGRPVLLVLRDGDVARSALLLGLGDTRAAIALDEHELRLGRATLERYWRGEYYALWRAPATLPDTIRLGESGAAVDWVRAALHEGEAARGAPFDAALAGEVRQLQAEFGSQPDGIVGPDTQFLLAARLADGPRLKKLED